MIKEAIIKKWFIIFVCSCLAIGLVVFSIESSPLYDIHGFNFTDITSIKIYDRGLLGNNVVEIKDFDKIQKIGRLINTAISISDYNPKANRGMCMLDLISKDNKITEITVSNNDAGGIINSGQWSYKSDSLLS